jgi:hypothetical protein
MYLICQISSLQAQISTDVFVDGPRELVVEFPSKESKHNRHNSHDNGQSNQHGLDFLPEMR